MADVYDHLDHESISQWIYCVCGVGFDLQKGHVLENSAGGDLPQETIDQLTVLSFPDSLSSINFDSFSFFTLPLSTTLDTLPFTTTLYAFTHFQQRQEPSLPRGFYQKALTIVSHLPLIHIFEETLHIAGPLYHSENIDIVSTIYNDSLVWPAPMDSTLYRLPMCGTTFYCRTPSHTPIPSIIINRYTRLWNYINAKLPSPDGHFIPFSIFPTIFPINPFLDPNLLNSYNSTGMDSSSQLQQGQAKVVKSGGLFAKSRALSPSPPILPIKHFTLNAYNYIANHTIRRYSTKQTGLPPIHRSSWTRQDLVRYTRGLNNVFITSLWDLDLRVDGHFTEFVGWFNFSLEDLSRHFHRAVTPRRARQLLGFRSASPAIQSTKETQNSQQESSQNQDQTTSMTVTLISHDSPQKSSLSATQPLTTPPHSVSTASHPKQSHPSPSFSDLVPPLNLQRQIHPLSSSLSPLQYLYIHTRSQDTSLFFPNHTDLLQNSISTSFFAVPLEEKRWRAKHAKSQKVENDEIPTKQPVSPLNQHFPRLTNALSLSPLLSLSYLFQPFLPHLHVILSLLLLNQPLIVYSRSSLLCSAFVSSLISLISPLSLTHTGLILVNAEELVRKRKQSPNTPKSDKQEEDRLPSVVFGVTNPLFLRAFPNASLVTINFSDDRDRADQTPTTPDHPGSSASPPIASTTPSPLTPQRVSRTETHSFTLPPLDGVFESTHIPSIPKIVVEDVKEAHRRDEAVRRAVFDAVNTLLCQFEDMFEIEPHPKRNERMDREKMKTEAPNPDQPDAEVVLDTFQMPVVPTFVPQSGFPYVFKFPDGLAMNPLQFVDVEVSSCSDGSLDCEGRRKETDRLLASLHSQIASLSIQIFPLVPSSTFSIPLTPPLLSTANIDTIVTFVSADRQKKGIAPHPISPQHLRQFVSSPAFRHYLSLRVLAGIKEAETLNGFGVDES
ncbi:hypothetical protein BLNAU_8115 [Blattamonas nauphoetae]|uniref:UDENN domain-containing protein n=1 Tax=Blattamonas nauphoetae TaxID=2049346 RepID=A0ABQ9XZA3_9EUKA|nr:hypothetical protein BLNAU_8115 [Blattamonas nauphoetae]